jgi:hypothetical protein
LPLPANASIAASATAASRSALVASPGLAVWIAPSASRQQPGHLRPVVEVDHGRRCATRRDDVGLRAAADERRHLVTVLEQLGQDVGADEACRACECHIHAGHHGRAPGPSNPGFP